MQIKISITITKYSVFFSSPLLLYIIIITKIPLSMKSKSSSRSKRVIPSSFNAFKTPEKKAKPNQNPSSNATKEYDIVDNISNIIFIIEGISDILVEVETKISSVHKDKPLQRKTGTIMNGVVCLTKQVRQLTLNSHSTYLSKTLVSRTRATFRAELKKEMVMLRQDIKTKSLSEYILQKIIAKEGNSTKLSSHMECRNFNGVQLPNPPNKDSTMPKETVNARVPQIRSSKRLKSISYDKLPYAVPTNGTHYTLREAVKIIMTLRDTGEKKSGLQFIRENTLPFCSPAKPRVVFEKSTLYHHLKTFKTSGVLPPDELDGSREGRPPYITTAKIDILNKTISLIMVSLMQIATQR